MSSGPGASPLGLPGWARPVSQESGGGVALLRPVTEFRWEETQAMRGRRSIAQAQGPEDRRGRDARGPGWVFPWIRGSVWAVSAGPGSGADTGSGHAVTMEVPSSVSSPRRAGAVPLHEGEEQEGDAWRGRLSGGSDRSRTFT